MATRPTDDARIQSFLTLVQMQTGHALEDVELDRLDPEEVLPTVLASQDAQTCDHQIRDIYDRCFPPTTKRKLAAAMCDSLVTTEAVAPPPEVRQPVWQPVHVRDPIDIWFRCLKNVSYVLFFNLRDVVKGQPALMGGQKLVGADASCVPIEKCRKPEGYDFKWGTLGPTFLAGHFREENPKEFGPGDPTMIVALDANGEFLSSHSSGRPTNKRITYARLADGKPDLAKPPVRIDRGDILDDRKVITDLEQIEFRALFKPNYSPDDLDQTAITKNDVKIFMGLGEGFMGEFGANATLSFGNTTNLPKGNNVRTTVFARDVEVDSVPPEIPGSRPAYTQLEVPANFKLASLLGTKLHFESWAATDGANARHDLDQRELDVQPYLYPDLDRVTVGKAKVRELVQATPNMRLTEQMTSDHRKEQGIVIDRLPCELADHIHDDRLDGPAKETYRIHLPSGFLTADPGASLKGWQIEIGYRDQDGKWLPNQIRKTLDAGDKSLAETFAVELERPRAIDRRPGQWEIEMRVYAPNNAPVRGYQFSVQDFEYAPESVYEQEK